MTLKPSSRCWRAGISADMRWWQRSCTGPGVGIVAHYDPSTAMFVCLSLGGLGLFVGVARVYMAVHFPTDVVGAWLLAFFLVIMSDQVAHWVWRRWTHLWSAVGSGSWRVSQPLSNQVDPRGPALSVILPVYNGERTLGQCLTALEKQTIPRSQYEVIVVDDGSTDATCAVAAGFPVR